MTRFPDYPIARCTVAVFLTTLAAVSCSNVAEQPILTRFFAASRLRDNTALQRFSTVIFEPRSQGIITSFEITDVGPERHMFAARSTLASGSSIIALSVDDPSHPVDFKQYDGDLVTKEVTILAPVRLPSGQTSRKTLVVTLQRAILKGEKEITGRWIITGIRMQD